MGHADDPRATRAAKASGGASVCLFAQYDPQGGLPEHTRRYLAHLAECGFAIHVARSADTDPDHTAWRGLAATGATVHPRTNRGLDFGAWGDLLRAGCAEGAGTVLLANDSVFGPYADLRPIFAGMRARRLDAWGMVESNERVPHLQSWFVCLSGRALAAPAVRRVFAQDFAAMSKEEIILHGELGLSVALRAAGLSMGSVWHPANRLRRLMPVNPSHFDWRGMLTSGAVPFLKAELVRDNPANLAWIGQWRGVVDRLEHGGAAAIDAALVAYAGQPADRAWPTPCRPARLIRTWLNILLTQDHAAALRAVLHRPAAQWDKPQPALVSHRR